MPWAKCRGHSMGFSTPGALPGSFRRRKKREGRAGRPGRRRPCPSTGPSASRPPLEQLGVVAHDCAAPPPY
eukprot:2724983-Pyramimonas_sp.AAC.1